MLANVQTLACDQWVAVGKFEKEEKSQSWGDLE